MYHSYLRRHTARVFEALGEDWRRSLENVTEDVHHIFPGEHPLGGERHSRAAVERWFERLARLFPGHDFEVHRVDSRGWPWDTWVAVRWSARLRPQVGEAYLNEGTHWLHLRWGKVDRLYAYLDSQRVASACTAMADAGIPEAADPPITD